MMYTGLAMVRGVSLLLLFLFAGEALAAALAVPIPGNVIGMALLLVALSVGWVKEEWVVIAADWLLRHMALFFVPAGVGVMLYADRIGREWLPIGVATLVSTFVVMAVTGWTEQLLDREREPGP